MTQSAHKYNHQKTTNPFYLYRVYSASRTLLYVGISTSVKRRVYEHRMTKGWWPKDALVESCLVGPRVIAQAAEAAAIQDEHPRHNFFRSEGSGAGAALRAHMSEKGLTVNDIAKVAAVEDATVERWLVNRNQILAAMYPRHLMMVTRRT